MAKSSWLIYGESGTYKTSQLGEIADYLFDRYGGITRLITADSGLGPVTDQINRGVIQPWVITGLGSFLGFLRNMSQGAWPNAFTSEFAAIEARGLTKTKDWAGISGVMVEGLTRIKECMFKALTDAQRSTGEPLAAEFVEMGVKFASPSRGTYGFTQNQTLSYVAEFASLPVECLVMTAHEGKGEDEVSKRSVFGPDCGGKALTATIGGKFQGVIHMESYMFTAQEKRKVPGVRAFFQRHQDPEVPGVFWPAKLGAPPRVTAKVLETWPEGYVPMILGADGVYQSSVATLMQAIEGEVAEIGEGQS